MARDWIEGNSRKFESWSKKKRRKTRRVQVEKWQIERSQDSGAKQPPYNVINLQENKKDAKGLKISNWKLVFLDCRNQRDDEFYDGNMNSKDREKNYERSKSFFFLRKECTRHEYNTPTPSTLNRAAKWRGAWWTKTKQSNYEQVEGPTPTLGDYDAIQSCWGVKKTEDKPPSKRSKQQNLHEAMHRGLGLEPKW